MTDLAATHGPWADLACEGISPAEADFSILGIPFDGLASARRGAALGPERMRFWSGHLTPFSEDRTRLRAMRIADLGDIQIAEAARDFDMVRQKVEGLTSVPILLGGDHSVTIPILQAQRARFAGSGWGSCGWMHTRTYAMSSTARGSRMPAYCGAGWRPGSIQKMSAW